MNKPPLLADASGKAKPRIKLENGTFHLPPDTVLPATREERRYVRKLAQRHKAAQLTKLTNDRIEDFALTVLTLIRDQTNEQIPASVYLQFAQMVRAESERIQADLVQQIVEYRSEWFSPSITVFRNRATGEAVKVQPNIGLENLPISLRFRRSKEPSNLPSSSTGTFDVIVKSEIQFSPTDAFPPVQTQLFNTFQSPFADDPAPFKPYLAAIPFSLDDIYTPAFPPTLSDSIFDYVPFDSEPPSSSSPLDDYPLQLLDR